MASETAKTIALKSPMPVRKIPMGTALETTATPISTTTVPWAAPISSSSEEVSIRLGWEHARVVS
jgi:hypothetical protein